MPGEEDMHDYSTTRGVGKFVAGAGWLVLVIGAVLLVVSFGTMRSGFGLLALAPAIGISLGGLLLICQGQLVQAVVDSAQNTAEVARDVAEMLRVVRSTGERFAQTSTNVSGQYTASTQPASVTTAAGTPTQVPPSQSSSYLKKEDEERIASALIDKYNVAGFYKESMMRFWLGKVTLVEEARAAERSGGVILLADANGQLHGFYPAKMVKELKDGLGELGG
jgi:hypothetical protein